MPTLEPVTTVEVIEQTFACWFGLSQSICGYNPRTPQIYFSLGEAVAAIGLIFAVIQLAKPSWNLTLAIKGRFLSNLVWLLSGLGLICVLIASLVPQIPNFYTIPLLGYPIFWEALGFLFFISAPTSLWYIARTRNGIFNAKRAERFYHAILREIGRGKPENLEAATDMLGGNLKQLTEAIEHLNFSHPYTDIPPELRSAAIAADLLNVALSEQQMADYIVTSRIDFVLGFVRFVKEKQLSHRHISMGLEKLVRHLFTNTNSFLYRQLDYEGLSLYAPLYDEIFGNSYLIGEFNLLKKWEEYGTPEEVRSDERYIQTFLKALECACKASGFSDRQSTEAVASALYSIPQYVDWLAWGYRKSSSYDSNQFSTILMHINNFFGRGFLFSYKEAFNAGTVSDYQKAAKKNRKYEQSLTASYAEALVELLGSISRIDDREMERHWAMQATEQILSFYEDTTIYENIRKCFAEYLWEQIEQNVKRGYFPAVLRIYIGLMSFKFTSPPSWLTNERDRLIDYLRNELKPRIVAKELMANQRDSKESELLPNEVIYNHKTGKFYMVFSSGTRKLLRK